MKNQLFVIVEEVRHQIRNLNISLVVSASVS